jgi:hypothetical protein
VVHIVAETETAAAAVLSIKWRRGTVPSNSRATLFYHKDQNRILFHTYACNSESMMNLVDLTRAYLYSMRTMDLSHELCTTGLPTRRTGNDMSRSHTGSSDR